MSKARRILVTTAHRGVFYGHLDPKYKDTDKTLALLNARNIIYWAGSRGFLGVAATGPDSGSKVGSVAERVVLHDVTSVTDCTAAAATKIEEWK